MADPKPSGRRCVTCDRDLMLGESVWESPITHNITPESATSTADYQCDHCHDVGEQAKTLLKGAWGQAHAVRFVREETGWTLTRSAEFVKAVKKESTNV